MLPRSTSPLTLGARPGGVPVRQCLRRTKGRVVCVHRALCDCPLADHLTDAERGVLNDIFRQASRLTTAIGWIFVVVALVATLLVLVG